MPGSSPNTKPITVPRTEAASPRVISAPRGIIDSTEPSLPE